MKSHFSFEHYRIFWQVHNYDQQAKDILFRNRLQCFSFLVSIAETTGINMNVENNMLHHDQS